MEKYQKKLINYIYKFKNEYFIDFVEKNNVNLKEKQLIYIKACIMNENKELFNYIILNSKINLYHKNRELLLLNLLKNGSFNFIKLFFDQKKYKFNMSLQRLKIILSRNNFEITLFFMKIFPDFFNQKGVIFFIEKNFNNHITKLKTQEKIKQF